MNRREFLNRSGAMGLYWKMGLSSDAPEAIEKNGGYEMPDPVSSEIENSVLPGTTSLTIDGDLATRMVAGIRRYLMQQTGEVLAERSHRWNREDSSPQHSEHSGSAHRESLRRMLGVVDPRVQSTEPQLLGSLSVPGEIAQGPGYKVSMIRWSVLARLSAYTNGLEAEGLLLQPENAIARVVAIPDADWTPEMLSGLVSGIPEDAQFARRLAEMGCEVVIPMLVSREDTFSGIPGAAMTNMPHREWIYRMAFEAGRHIIGFEIQKVLAAVDWFEIRNKKRALPIGVMGYGEGGLLALYSGAIDPRIEATVLSGYFQEREVWKEPIYRDVWGLSREFGDPELAGLIAPRALIVEACRSPEVTGPPLATVEHKPFACPNGTLGTPALTQVQGAVDRARPFFKGLAAGERLRLVVSGGGEGSPGSDAALQAFLQTLGIERTSRSTGGISIDSRWNYDPLSRLRRQFTQMVDFTQAVIAQSPHRRKEFWNQADRSSLQSWKESTKFYRNYIWQEVIGRMPAPNQPANPRTRLLFEEPKYRAYEVMLDVWPEVFACGILLLPKDIKDGERRPVVVCQHGLEARSRDVADPKIDDPFYRRFGARLAEEGFVVYAPQNPYVGKDDFRIIQRMGHPLKLSLFSFILGQHEQLLNWLTTQTFVDPERIGFYGLSYGGKTAVRVPPLLDRYALSICSGDFNEWVWKTTTVSAPQSYLLTAEYDMYEFNFANVCNYADLANLMAPRPFMVERGHDDVVGVDEWVAYEYSHVREFYDKMGIGNQTEIEFFNGPHTIHGVGTFEFLRRHLH